MDQYSENDSELKSQQVDFGNSNIETVYFLLFHQNFLNWSEIKNSFDSDKSPMSQDVHLSIWESLQKELIERYREKQLEEEE